MEKLKEIMIVAPKLLSAKQFQKEKKKYLILEEKRKTSDKNRKVYQQKFQRNIKKK